MAFALILMGESLENRDRPSFSGAASPEEGRRAYEHFLKALNDLGMPVQTGEFGADMKVNLVNDGPATFWLSR